MLVLISLVLAWAPATGRAATNAIATAIEINFRMLHSLSLSQVSLPGAILAVMSGEGNASNGGLRTPPQGWNDLTSPRLDALWGIPCSTFRRRAGAFSASPDAT